VRRLTDRDNRKPGRPEGLPRTAAINEDADAKKAPAIVMGAPVRLLLIGPSNPFADVQRRRKGNAQVLKVHPPPGFSFKLNRPQTEASQRAPTNPCLLSASAPKEALPTAIRDAIAFDIAFRRFFLRTVFSI